MRIVVLGLVVMLLGGCATAMKDSAPAAGMADGTAAVWLGLDDAGETWWRLELFSSGRGNAAIARGNAVATYRVTAWSIDDAGRAAIHLERSGDATAGDKFPPSVKLAGAADDHRMRLAVGKSEVVFWREDRLIRQRNLLRQRMAGNQNE